MLNFVVISYNNTYSYLKTNICLNWKYVLSFQAAPNLNKNIFCVQVTFYNPIKAGFSNNKYPVTFQTCKKNINSIFLIENPVLLELLKIIGATGY